MNILKQNQQNLKPLFQSLKRLKRPNSPQEDDLAELVELIMELDPYYAGLALSVAEGAKININQLYNLGQLKSKFKKIYAKSQTEEEILNQCKAYLNLFDQIHNTLISATP